MSTSGEKTQQERDEARLLVAEANNSLYGSQGYFHSLNGGPFDKYHLARGIENLKTSSRRQAAAEALAATLLAALKALVDPDLTYSGASIIIPTATHGDAIRLVREARHAIALATPAEGERT